MKYIALWCALAVLGILQYVAGLAWIGLSYGWAWAIASVVFSLYFSKSFGALLWFVTGSIGGFFCAVEIWDWHWLAAALFVFPNIAFRVVAMAAEYNHNRDVDALEAEFGSKMNPSVARFISDLRGAKESARDEGRDDLGQPL